MSIRALVVGGTGGIGYAIANRLAAQAASSFVTISGRTKPQNMPHANMEFRQLDASSMRQIKSYAESFNSTPEQKLDLLIMTQGIMTLAGRTETPEGIDRKMALHYYGKQLLIRELLPSLKDDAKVLIVFDGIYGNPAKLNWDDLDLKKHFSLGTAANHCMVLNDAMVQHFALQQQKEGKARRSFVHAWPGGVKTNVLQELPWYIRGPGKVIGSLIAVSPETCADNLINGLDQVVAASREQGRFWSNMDNKGHVVPNKKVWSEEEMKKIADHTWEVIDGGMARAS